MKESKFNELKDIAIMILPVIPQLIIIVLKLVKAVSWRWVWVLAPTWISLIASALFLGLAAFSAYIRQDK